MTESLPMNWGDWKPCKTCKTLTPPTSLGADGCCLDKAWCAKAQIHGFAPVMSVSPKQPETPAPKPKKPPKRKKK